MTLKQACKEARLLRKLGVACYAMYINKGNQAIIVLGVRDGIDEHSLVGR